MFTERTSTGLDVHVQSVAAAAIDGVTGGVFRARLTPGNEEIIDWVRSLPGPSAALYEAGPTGFGLSRALTAAGIRCEVAAPSKIQRPCGDRVKTDARDAMHLAKLLRLDEIVAVAVPSLAQEAARDLVRAREDVRGDLMPARHRVSKLLLRQGIVYCGGSAWTGVHLVWLRSHHFDAPGLQAAFDAEHEAVLASTSSVTPQRRSAARSYRLTAPESPPPASRSGRDDHVTRLGHNPPLFPRAWRGLRSRPCDGLEESSPNRPPPTTRCPTPRRYRRPRWARPPTRRATTSGAWRRTCTGSPTR